MKHHPFSEYWPLLSGENFEKFKADIAANGQKLPILTYQDQILDGRNRERACEELGIAARYENSGATSDEDALNLVVSLNEHRRHLSEEQRLFAAARLANLRAGSNQHEKVLSFERTLPSKAMTLQEAAKKMKVSHGSATRARAVLQHGTKEDEEDVVSGRISLTRKAEDLLAKHSLRGPNKRADKTTIAIPYEDVITKLRPLIKRVKEQSKRHAATVSFVELSRIAFELDELADAWTKNGLEPGTHSEPVPLYSVHKGR